MDNHNSVCKYVYLCVPPPRVKDYLTKTLKYEKPFFEFLVRLFKGLPKHYGLFLLSLAVPKNWEISSNLKELS